MDKLSELERLEALAESISVSDEGMVNGNRQNIRIKDFLHYIEFLQILRHTVIMVQNIFFDKNMLLIK